MGWFTGYLFGSAAGRAAGRQSVYDDIRDEGYQDGKEEAMEEARQALFNASLDAKGDPKLAPGLAEARRRLGPPKEQQFIRRSLENPNWSTLASSIGITLIIVGGIFVYQDKVLSPAHSGSFSSGPFGNMTQASGPGGFMSMTTLLDLVPILGIAMAAVVMISGVQNTFWEWVPITDPDNPPSSSKDKVKS